MSLADEFFNFLVNRDIERGKLKIDSHEAALRAIEPGAPGAPNLFHVLAGWAEYSKTALESARRLYLAYSQQPWPTFSIDDWALIEVGKGSLALYEGRLDDVEAAWRWMEANASKLSRRPELLATIAFVRARAKKKTADYPVALEMIGAAIRHYAHADLRGMAAVAQATEGWLFMQLGNRQKAIESWEAAEAFLTNTEDYTILANILFGKGRYQCRAGLDQEARTYLCAAIALYAKCKPCHRNLCRAYLELANVDLRLAVNAADKKEAPARRESANENIQAAAAMLQDDTLESRNAIRLLLAQANQALSAENLGTFRARRSAKTAYELAEKAGDQLMMARARYRQAGIEFRAADDYTSTDPVRLRVLAYQYALEALGLAGQLHNDRLVARIQTLLGNLHLQEPFCDQDYANHYWEGAVEHMKQHEDFDHVAQEIAALGQKLNGPAPAAQDSPVVVVVNHVAFTTPLKKTRQTVEKAIVLKAVDLIGPNARAIGSALHAGKNKIERYLEKPAESTAPAVSTYQDIFRVKLAFALSRPLEETIKTVERKVILAAWIHYGCDIAAVKDNLHIGFDKVMWALSSGRSPL